MSTIIPIEYLADKSTPCIVDVDLRQYISYPGMDANRIYRFDDCVIGFHVTTLKNAENILREGPQERVAKIGFFRRDMPPAFWLNCVPWVPYSIEQTHPAFLGHEASNNDMAVLAALMKVNLATKNTIIEPTWYWLQWAAKAHEVSNIVLVPPEMFGQFRSNKSKEKLREYLDEGLRYGYFDSESYAGKLTKILTPETSQTAVAA